jgi:signal transduction histidine kinase
MSGTTYDITDRKLVELERNQLLIERESEAEELRAVKGRLERGLAALLGLHEVSQLLTSDSDQDAIARQLLEVALRAANLRAATLRHRVGKGRLRLWQRVGDEAVIRAVAGGATATLIRASTMAIRRPNRYQTRWLDAANAELTVWCVPLIVKDRVIGVLEAIGEARPSDELTCEILGSIALQAATAIENARLYREVADRERALHHLVQQLMATQEDERRHLAYEIHDGFAQLASGVQQLLEAYAHDLPPESDVARQRMEVLLNLAGRTVEEIRRVLAGLRPTVLDDFGLASGLRAYADGLASEGQRVQFAETLGPVRLPSHVEIALFRLAQEALSNVKRHAGVESAELRLTRTSEHIMLEVKDQGRGFDLTSVKRSDRPGEHMGLLSMQERIAQIGGVL